MASHRVLHCHALSSTSQTRWLQIDRDGHSMIEQTLWQLGSPQLHELGFQTESHHHWHCVWRSMGRSLTSPWPTVVGHQVQRQGAMSHSLMNSSCHCSMSPSHKPGSSFPMHESSPSPPVAASDQQWCVNVGHHTCCHHLWQVQCDGDALETVASLFLPDDFLIDKCCKSCHDNSSFWWIVRQGRKHPVPLQ